MFILVTVLSTRITVMNTQIEIRTFIEFMFSGGQIVRYAYTQYVNYMKMIGGKDEGRGV